jgi:selenocysteine lyase/cysteine desulfurase
VTLALREQPVTPVAPAGAAPLLPVVGVTSIPLADGSHTRPIYLDYAATAPALPAVVERVTGLLPQLASVHRGAGWGSQVTTAAYEDARATVARILGARPDDAVVFTRNTTDALNLLASAVPGEAVLLDLEHHANLLPWRRRGARILSAPRSIDALVHAVDAELRRRPAALLAVTAVTNVTGELLPLGRLAEVAHNHGARIAVDGAQLVPHRPLSIEALGIDYLALSGHKAYAPFGAGALIGRTDWLDAAHPYLDGGGAVGRVRLDAVELRGGSARHEAGTPNVLGAVALATALRTLDTIHPDARDSHEAALRDGLLRTLAGVPGLHQVTAFDDAPDRLGVAAFALEGISAGRLAAALGAEHGISVRSGRFCAHPLVDRLSDRPLVRASVGVGSTLADIEALGAALHEIAARGPRLEYVRQASGEWQPVDDQRDPRLALPLAEPRDGGV